MKDHLISMFIDNELALDEKIEFVETVHSNGVFKEETVDLLHQETFIRMPVVSSVPRVNIHRRKVAWRHWFQPLGLFTSGLAAAVLLFFFLMPTQETESIPHRFVIYRPDAGQAEIAGSFTNWNVIPMNRSGSSGYWEITLDLPGGEHRFSYIFDGDTRIADPTILTREKDDFGGENSVIEVAA
jgi:Glycogen recognition site of AMP-activated protein kinase